MKRIILDSVSFDWRLQQMITTLRASWYDRKQDKEFTSTYKVRHQLTPQHYVYTDENSSNRLYVSGAFQSGKLTREEFNMIERELWAKWREIEPHYKKVVAMRDIVTFFVGQELLPDFRSKNEEVLAALQKGIVDALLTGEKLSTNDVIERFHTTEMLRITRRLNKAGAGITIERPGNGCNIYYMTNEAIAAYKAARDNA